MPKKRYLGYNYETLMRKHIELCIEIRQLLKNNPNKKYLRKMILHLYTARYIGDYEQYERQERRNDSQIMRNNIERTILTGTPAYFISEEGLQTLDIGAQTLRTVSSAPVSLGIYRRNNQDGVQST